MIFKSSFTVFVICVHNIVFQTNNSEGTNITEENVTGDLNEPFDIPNSPDVTHHKNLHFLDHNLCGPVNEPKIFGGDKIGVFEFPWMALLEYEVKEEQKIYFRFRSAGTIINKRFILTAAHCVTHSNISKNWVLKNVRVGDHNLDEERECDKDMNGFEIVCAEKYQEFGIEKLYPHPKYTHEPTSANDIALVKLNKNIDFTSYNVRPICLPIASHIQQTQKMMTVSGWGETENGSGGELLAVHLPLFPFLECQILYSGSRTQITINYTQMCAGGVKGRDSCIGDSGGPLQAPGIYRNDVRFIQFGVVSFGFPNCGSPELPGVYTRVSYFMDWILDNIDE